MIVQRQLQNLLSLLGVRGGGRTIEELDEGVSPVIEVGELYFPILTRSVLLNAVGGETSVATGWPEAPGLYHVRGILTGFVTTGITAGIVSLEFVPTISSNIPIIRATVAASTTHNFAPVFFDTLMDLPDAGDTVAITTVVPANMTTVQLRVYYTTVKVRETGNVRY